MWIPFEWTVMYCMIHEAKVDDYLPGFPVMGSLYDRGTYFSGHSGKFVER